MIKGLFTKKGSDGFYLLNNELFEVTSEGLREAADYEGVEIVINNNAYQVNDLTINLNNSICKLRRIKKLPYYYFQDGDDIYLSMNLIHHLEQELATSSYETINLLINKFKPFNELLELIIKSGEVNSVFKTDLLNYLTTNGFSYDDKIIKLIINESSIDVLSKTVILNTTHLSDKSLLTIIKSNNIPGLPKTCLINLLLEKYEFTPRMVMELIRGVRSVWGVDNAVEAINYKGLILTKLVSHNYELTTKQVDFIIKNNFSYKIKNQALSNHESFTNEQLRELINQGLIKPLARINKLSIISVEELINKRLTDSLIDYYDIKGLTEEQVNKVIDKQLIKVINHLIKSHYKFTWRQKSKIKHLKP